MNIAGVESTPARPPTAARRHRITGRARVEILFIYIDIYLRGRPRLGGGGRAARLRFYLPVE